MADKARLLPLALLSVALAQPALAQKEGLLDIYQRAMANDPAVREAEANYLATAQVKPQARSALLPQLSLGTTRSNRFQDTRGGALDPTGQPIGTRSQFEQYSKNWNISLTQTLFDWGQYATLRQADKVVTRAATDYQAAQQDLVLRVADAYFNVLAAEDNLASAIAAREAIGRQLEQAQRRFEVGLIAITDVQQSQAGYDDAVAAVIEAERLLATAHEFLREIIGDDVTELAAPTDDLPLLTPDPANAEQWVSTALQQNLQLVSSRIAADIAADEIDIQKANRLPTLSLSAGYSEANNDQTQTVFQSGVPSIVSPSATEPQGRNWSLDVRVPIFSGGLNRARIQQSVYQHRAATEALERIARQTERQARDAYLGVISEISRVRALRQAVESNRTALRATEAGFEVGTQTTVDVLAAQNNLRRAETTYSRSRYDYILNILRLKQAAGSLNVADVEQVDSWLQR
jgi:outer membrane protein